MTHQNVSGFSKSIDVIDMTVTPERNYQSDCYHDWVSYGGVEDIRMCSDCGARAVFEDNKMSRYEYPVELELEELEVIAEFYPNLNIGEN